jgi:hypothetical protein
VLLLVLFVFKRKKTSDEGQTEDIQDQPENELSANIGDMMNEE